MPAISRNNPTSTSSQGQSVGRIGGGKGYGLFAGKTGSSGYEPTVIALVVLILLEFAGYAALRYTFRSVHGG